MAKSNIAVFCLLGKFKREFSVCLAKTFKMFFADVDEIIDYENTNLKDLLKLKGNGFYESLERKTISSVCDFENSVINTAISAALSGDNLKKIKEKCLVVFVKVSKNFYIKSKQSENMKENTKFSFDQNLFNERTKIFENASDIIVATNGKSVQATVSNAIKLIKKQYNI